MQPSLAKTTKARSSAQSEGQPAAMDTTKRDLPQLESNTSWPAAGESLPVPQEAESAATWAGRAFLLLMADDDPEDCLLVREAIRENGLPHRVQFVHNGEELLEYLGQSGPRTQNRTVLPDLLLLDLNMPKLDGREALRRLKSDLRLQALPVVVLTTSTAEEDVRTCYQMGAASFISKPVTYRGWLDLVRDLCGYWFERVRLPCPEKL